MIKASLATYFELSKLTSVFCNVYHYEAFIHVILIYLSFKWKYELTFSVVCNYKYRPQKTDIHLFWTMTR